MDPLSINALLKQKKLRTTPIRKLLIESLAKSPYPLSAIDIKLILQQQDTLCNKTTIYREIQSLVRSDLLKEVDFGEGKKRYEITNSHHHHLVCQKCKRIKEIDLDLTKFEEQLLILQNKINNFSDFKINQHNLEFFGICKVCSK